MGKKAVQQPHNNVKAEAALLLELDGYERYASRRSAVRRVLPLVLTLADADPALHLRLILPPLASGSQWLPWRRFFDLRAMEAGLFGRHHIRLLDADDFMARSDAAVDWSVFLWPGGNTRDGENSSCPANGTFGFSTYLQAAGFYSRAYAGQTIQIASLHCIPTGADASSVPHLQPKALPH